jgi:hypothetical protein
MSKTKEIERDDLSKNDVKKTKDFYLEQQMYNKSPFLFSNYKEFNLPSDTLFAQFIFSEFYFPDDCNYPIPSPQIFTQISPVLINVDFLTLLWINALSITLYKEKLNFDQKEFHHLSSDFLKKDKQHSLHCDTYVEFIMPKISLSINPNNPQNDQVEKRPCGIEIGISRIYATNQKNSTLSTLSSSNYNPENFKQTSQNAYQSSQLLSKLHSNFNSLYLNKSDHVTNDLKIKMLAPCFNDILNNENLQYSRYDLSGDKDLTKLINTENLAENNKVGLILKSLSKNALNKTSNKDVWFLNIESLWVDILNDTPVKSSDLENSAIIQNASFNFWFINVWDFYDSFNETNITNQSNKDDSFVVISLSNNSNRKIIDEKIDDSIIDDDDFEKNYPKLDNLIKIENCNSNVVFAGKEKRSKSFSNVSRFTKTKKKSVNLSQTIYSKFNIIGYTKELNILMNHSNMLFLLQLINVFDEFSEQIKLDTEETLKYQSDFASNSNIEIKSYKSSEVNETSLNVSFIIDQIEIELHINDYHIENSYIKNIKIKDALKKATKKEKKYKTEKEELEKTVSTIPDLLKRDENNTDYEIFSKNSTREIINSYINYIYGISDENHRDIITCLNRSLNFDLNSNKIGSSSEISDSVIIEATTEKIQTSSFSLSDSKFLDKNVLSNSIINPPELFKNNNLQVSQTDLFEDENENMILEQDRISISSYSTDVVASTKIEVSESIFYEKFSTSNTIESDLSSIEKEKFIQTMSDAIIENDRIYETNQTQTKQSTTSIKFKIFKLETYFQYLNTDLSLIAKSNNLELDEKKSYVFDHSKENSKSEFSNENILFFFKMVSSDKESSKGIVHVFLKDTSLEANMQTLSGLADFFDDKETFDSAQKTIPVNLIIENCSFCLTNDENVSKKMNIFISKMLINKLNNNDIIISEMNLPLTNVLKYTNKKSKKIETENDLNKSLQNDQLVKILRNRSVKIKDDKAKFNQVYSDQLASLVYMLRQTKNCNLRLESQLKERQEKLEIEKLKNAQITNELNELRQKLNDANIFDKESQVNRTIFDKSQSDLERKLNQYELERNQFESLLKQYEEENTSLNQKLKISEERTAILQEHNSCLIKKLNKHL